MALCIEFTAIGGDINIVYAAVRCERPRLVLTASGGAWEILQRKPKLAMEIILPYVADYMKIKSQNDHMEIS